MGRSLILRDSLGWSFQQWSFVKDVPQEISDDWAYARIIDNPQFEEMPPAATYWVRATGKPIVVFVDGVTHTIEEKLLRVTRRVFSKLTLHLLHGRLQRIFVREILDTDPESPWKILVTRDMGAGDVLIATDVVHNLHLRYPNAKISFATMRHHRCLLKGHPEVEEVPLLGERDPREWDVDIFLPRRSEIFPDMTVQVRSEMYLAEAGLLPASGHQTTLRLEQWEIDDAAELIAENGGAGIGRTLSLQPCGSGYHRSLSPEVRIGVARAAVADGWQVVVFGNGLNHWPFGEEEGIVNLCGKLEDVRQAAAVIATSDLFIGPDSGGYHMAAALDPPIPSLVVFTTIAPELRLRDYPWAMSYLGGPEDLNCRPCWDRMGCRGMYPCVNDNDPAKIWNAAKEWWLACR